MKKGLHDQKKLNIKELDYMIRGFILRELHDVQNTLKSKVIHRATR